LAQALFLARAKKRRSRQSESEDAQVAIEFRLADGTEYVDAASQLLAAAWRPPALHYSPEYLSWQLSFPGPGGPPPAAAAFEGSRMVGFAASIHRRLRQGADLVNALVVTFVAVDPAFRNRGVATGLYDLLLKTIQEWRMPIVTFAIPGSGGERAIQSAYARVGLELTPFGEYPHFACLAAQPGENPEWIAAGAGEVPAALRAAIAACAADPGQPWSDPSDAQIDHYLQDPRGRRLLVRRAPDSIASAAWALPVEFVSPAGVQSALTLESIWIPRTAPASLGGLASAAAALWPAFKPAVVQAPNMFGFDSGALRLAGFRQAGTRLRGYLASAPGERPLGAATGTNLELV
jgi:hypothetical protein